MVTLRPTKMLARRLGIPLPTVPPSVHSRVADWCAHSFELGGESWLIFCNTASLYSVFAKADRVTDADSLARRAGGMALKVIRENRFAPQVKIFESAISFYQWAPIPDRSVLGSINEMIWLASDRLAEPGLTPEALADYVNAAPMSALGMNSPARAFASLSR